DLRRALELQLATLGVDAARIERVGGCTRCDGEDYHSYRRDGAGSGRMVAWVGPR
ncbi:laccase domain-containing protein, partial [bacterium]